MSTLLDNERAALLQNILTCPDDPAARLVYADWLDDQGEAQLAENVRRTALPEPAAFTLPIMSGRAHWGITGSGDWGLLEKGQWGPEHLLNLFGVVIRFRTSRPLPFAWGSCRGLRADACGHDGAHPVCLWGLELRQVLEDARAHDDPPLFPPGETAIVEAQQPDCRWQVALASAAGCLV